MKIVVLFSGGLDSTTLLAGIVETISRVGTGSDGLDHGKQPRILALSINYGQRHETELRHARRLAQFYKVRHEVVELGAEAVFRGSALTSPEIAVPHGRYDAPTMESTVVPNRNMVLLSIATAKAISIGYDTVAYAAHSGDHAIYPDCRPKFVKAMGRAMALCGKSPVKLLTPFLDLDKADIVQEGDRLGVPFRETYSCYEGNPRWHCGFCGTCHERREAFRISGIPDPTHYAGEKALRNWNRRWRPRPFGDKLRDGRPRP